MLYRKERTMVTRECFTTEEISACTSKEQLTELFCQALSRKILMRTAKEYGLNISGLEFCSKEKLAGYLAGEFLILRQKKPLRRQIGLFSRLAGALEHKCVDMALSLSGATLAGMMIFMLVL